jgi:hypothetical protein
MANRMELDPEALRSARDREDRENFNQWQQWQAAFRNSRNNFHNEGGLPDAPPGVAEVLDSLLKTKSPLNILEALARELNGSALFHSAYVEFIELMHARKLIDDQQRTDYLSAGNTLVETQKSAQATIEQKAPVGIITGDPVIDEALKDM